MNVAEIAARIAQWWGHLATHKQVILGLATTVFLIEVLLRTFARDSVAYKKWQHVFESIGAVWTAVILAIVYFLSVSVMSLFLKLTGKDPLDKTLAPAPTFWRRHEPNPLGPLAAARHQF